MRAPRVDANQSSLVSLARKLGYTVAFTHMVAGGFPDLVIGQWGLTFLIEIKDGSKLPRDRELTSAQVTFHSNWKGQVDIIASEDEFLEWDKKMRRRYYYATPPLILSDVLPDCDYLS